MQVALSVVQKGLRPVIPTTCTTAQANIIRVRCAAVHCSCIVRSLTMPTLDC
jgi:hypothetical protein